MPRYTIAIANRQKIVKIDRRSLAQLARSLLTRELVASAEISVAIVDDLQIHAINRQFLNHDYPTDVISFLLDGHAAPEKSRRDGRPPASSRLSASAPLPLVAQRPDRRATGSSRRQLVRRGAGKVIGGEVVMSAETAVRTAHDYAVRPADEVALYLVHGLLHLCGYDDLTPPEKRLMRRREAEALKDWKF